MNELRGTETRNESFGFRQVDLGGGRGVLLGALVVCNRIV